MAKRRAPTLSAVSSSGHSRLQQSVQVRKASNSELPNDCLVTWRKVYIPTLLQYLGTIADPWDLTGFIEKAQELYNNCFPSSPYDITYKGDRRAQLVSKIF